MDDNSQIVFNPKVQTLANWPSIFASSSLNQAGTEQGIYYKPLMILVYGIIWQLSPGEPFWFHIVQILLHAANAALVSLLLTRFLRWQIALLGGLVFLCHPFNAEAAIYLADLQDILFLFFGLLALYFLSLKPQLRWRDLLPLSLLLMASLLSKESGLLFMFVIGVYTWLFLRPNIGKVVALLLAVGTGYFILRYWVAGLHSLEHNVTQIGRASMAVRLLTAPRVLWSYLADFVLPLNFTTTQDWVVSQPNMDFWGPLAGLVVITAATIIYGLKKDSRAYWLMFWWAVAGLGFHSHILVALDGTLAPRWFYFPMIGLCGMILLAVENVLLRNRRTAGTFALVLLAAFSFASYTRAMEWRNNFTLFSAEIEKLPGSYVVQNNYGVELFNRGNLVGAKEHFQESVNLAPQWTINWNNLGAVYQREGKLTKALELYRQSVNNGPYATAYENYVAILVTLNQEGEARRFLTDTALAQFPRDATLLRYQQVLGSAAAVGNSSQERQH